MQVTNSFSQPGHDFLAQGYDHIPDSSPTDTNLESDVERFLKESGFHHQLVLEGFTGHFKDTLERYGFHAAAIQQRGSCLKIRLNFPPQHTPSKKFKLYQQMNALIYESGYKARRLWLVVHERRVTMWVVPQSN